MDINLDTARFNMIQQQIRPWGVIDDRVLDTLAAIPRERFVPDAYRGLALCRYRGTLGWGPIHARPQGHRPPPTGPGHPPGGLSTNGLIGFAQRPEGACLALCGVGAEIGRASAPRQLQNTPDTDNHG